MSLSIIIPTYNEEKYIGNLLTCLTNQTFKDFEVIVVDKSVDNTIKVCNTFKNRLDLKVIKSDRLGVAYQRNLGAKHSKFDQLLFLDADVKINNNFLYKSFYEIKRRKLGIASAEMIPDLKNWYYKVFFKSIHYVMLLTQFINLGGIGACIFVSKNLFFKVNGFNEKLRITSDHEFIQRVSKKGKFRLLNSTNFIFSVRRFEKYGTKKTMLELGKITGLYFLIGPRLFNKKKIYQFGKY